MLNFCFATHAPGVSAFGKYMLLLRVLFSAFLIAAGIFTLQNPASAPQIEFSPEVFAYIQIATGASLLLGFLSRFSMIASSIVFTAVALNSVSAGLFDSDAILGLFSSVAFLVLGSGKYSCDFLLKKVIVKQSMKSNRIKKSKRMTYKAFSMHDC